MTNTYAWTKQPKQLQIRPYTSPQKGMALSGVVIVVDGGIGHCYVRFSQAVVEIIGRKMPYGIGIYHTAYLKVVRRVGYYDIMAVYLDRSKQVFLWRSETLPSWVSRVRIHHERNKKK